MEKQDQAMKEVGGISLSKIVFDGLWAIVDSMKMCLKFQTKTQIVIDYDPQEEKWKIKYYQKQYCLTKDGPRFYGASNTRNTLAGWKYGDTHTEFWPDGYRVSDKEQLCDATMGKHEVIEHSQKTLAALGKCMEILLQRPDDQNALQVCSTVSSGLYLLTLKLMHNRVDELKPEAFAEMVRGADLLRDACVAFSGDCTALENVSEALRILHRFQLCREHINLLTKGLADLSPVTERTGD